jgi:hypothetical protein
VQGGVDQSAECAPDKHSASGASGEAMSRSVTDVLGWGAEVDGRCEDPSSADIKADHVSDVCRGGAAGVDYLLHGGHGDRAGGGGYDHPVYRVAVDVSQNERMYQHADEQDAGCGLGGASEVNVADGWVFRRGLWLWRWRSRKRGL